MQGTVVKFGGTSLGDAARIARVAQTVIAMAGDGPLLVVVSAMAGVTRRLRGIIALARPAPLLALAELESLLIEHRQVAATLGADADVTGTGIENDHSCLLAQIGNGNAAAADRLLAGGERLSALLLRAALEKLGHDAIIVAAEQLIATDDRHGNAEVDRARTAQAIAARKPQFLANRICIVAGFTGASPAGHTTTLGSNASDYSAALIAAALAWPLQIWTDVAGCYDADPRHVPGARLLPSLSLVDADRYARAGASVIHPRTLEPLLETPVAVSIVNSFAPDVAGTRIAGSGSGTLHGIAVRDDVATTDVLDALAPGEEQRVAVLSVFDDRVPAGLAARCGDALARHGIPVLELHWSAAARCVEVVIAASAAVTAARCLHAALFAGRDRVEVGIALIGASGRVATRLLQLIGRRRHEHDSLGIDLRLVAVADSRRARIDAAGIDADAIADVLAAAPATPLATWSHDLLALPQRPLLLLDCTASADVAACYPEWLAAGIDIVTPNKHGPAAASALDRAIATAQAHSGARLACETTVGAQLPLLRTLRDLRAAGDDVEELEAVLSGTLSFVLNRVGAGIAFSTAVREAVDLGYAEPHPAADLSGADAARKLVILLRALGVRIDFDEIEVVAPLPADLLADPDPARLLDGLRDIDKSWSIAATEARAAGETWIYRARYRDGIARIAPERIALDHPLARLLPCENALRLATRYYRSAPLTISGPGAGIDLTAAGVHADVLDVLDRYRPVTGPRTVTGSLPEVA